MVKPYNAFGPYQSLTEARQFYIADLYKFILAPGGGGGNVGGSVTLIEGGTQNYGAVLTYTSGDRSIVAPDGLVYSAGAVDGGPFFATSGNKFKLHQKVGLEVDSVVFDVLPGTATVFGQSFLTACRTGVFDGAFIRIDRAFMAPKYGDFTSVAPTIVNLFYGRVGEIDAGRSLATFTVNSMTELLNMQWPRNLFQPACVNMLGDIMCGVGQPGTLYYGAGKDSAGNTLPAWPQQNSTIASVTDDLNIGCNLTDTGTPGYYDLGKVYFTSGALAGTSRSIRTSSFGTPGAITLVSAMPGLPVIGDGITVFAGCDKSLAGANGCPKFSNTIHFRGFPFIPTPETAV